MKIHQKYLKIVYLYHYNNFINNNNFKYMNFHLIKLEYVKVLIKMKNIFIKI